MPVVLVSRHDDHIHELTSPSSTLLLVTEDISNSKPFFKTLWQFTRSPISIIQYIWLWHSEWHKSILALIQWPVNGPWSGNSKLLRKLQRHHEKLLEPWPRFELVSRMSIALALPFGHSSYYSYGTDVSRINLGVIVLQFYISSSHTVIEL